MTEPTKTASEMPAATKPTSGETPAADTTEETFDEARAKALIAKLRAEVKDASKAQKRLADLEAAEAKRAEEQLTAAQLADRRLTELQAKLAAAETAAQEREQAIQHERAEHAIELLARDPKYNVDPEAAVKLLDWPMLAYDAQGKPTNLPKVFEALLKKFPFLANPGSGPTFGTPAARPRTGQPLPPNTPRKIIPL